MKLVASKTSPYARKVRVLLAEKRLSFEFIEENVWSPETTVPRLNPLGKVPVLVLDEGLCLYDSRVIAEYLDALVAPALIPASGMERILVRRDEALGDGIADAGIAVFLEGKRDPARQDGAGIARQRSKIDGGIAALASVLAGKPYLRGAQATLGDIACACALSWLEFRLPAISWCAGRGNLAAWLATMEARPAFVATRPQA